RPRCRRWPWAGTHRRWITPPPRFPVARLSRRDISAGQRLFRVVLVPSDTVAVDVIDRARSLLLEVRGRSPSSDALGRRSVAWHGGGMRSEQVIELRILGAGEPGGELVRSEAQDGAGSCVLGVAYFDHAGVATYLH